MTTGHFERTPIQNINELDLGKRTYTAYKTRATESLRAFIETDDADVEQQALQRVDALASKLKVGNS